MIAVAEMSAALGYCDVALPPRMSAAIERLGLPTCHAFDSAAALAAMGTDKKRRGRSLRFVLFRRHRRGVCGGRCAGNGNRGSAPRDLLTKGIQ